MKRNLTLISIWLSSLLLLAAAYYVPIPYPHLPQLDEFDCEESLLAYTCARGSILGALMLAALFTILFGARRRVFNRVRRGALRVVLFYCFALIILLVVGRSNYEALVHYRAIAAGEFHGLGSLRFFHISQLWFDMLQAGIITVFCELARRCLDREASGASVSRAE